jgi:hypothetical protein
MSLKHCLDTAVAAKEISQAAADELDTVYNRFREQYATIHGDAEARRRAQEELATRLEVTAAHKRRVALLQASAIEGRWKDLSAYRNARGEIDVASALLELVETHGRRDTGLASGSLSGKSKAMFGAAVAEFEGALDALDRDVIGRRKNRATGDNIVRELHGQDTGDAAAKTIASTFARLAEGMRQRFNEAGGAIGKLERWALPQHHDGAALLRAGFDTWQTRITPLLDWDAMKHAGSGTPILPGERAEVLRHVFDTITSEGWAGRTAQTQPIGTGALWKSHADHRFLQFKNADAWLAYSRDFGQADPLSVMMGHFKVMTRDIAAMELLGPNPQATMEWLKQRVTIEADKATRGEPALVPRKSELLGLEKDMPLRLGRTASSRARRTLHRVDAMWQMQSGAADVAVDTVASAVGTTARNVVTATSLGSAVLSAPSDQAFGAFARSFAAGASVPGSLVNQIKVIVGGIAEHVTGREGTRAQAARAGILFDHLANTFGERAREAGLVSGPRMSRWVADQVMRKQLLAALTSTQKNGFGLWLMGEIGDEVGKRWDDVHAPVRRTLQRYGLNKQDWDVMSLARRHDLSPDGEGATVLRAREIAELGVDDLGRLLQQDRNDALAGRQALAEIERQLFTVSDDVRAQVETLITQANAANLTVLQMQQIVARIVGPGGKTLPKKLIDQLMAPRWTRESYLATLRDIAGGGYARTEIARVRWRETPDYQALPQWLRDILDAPDMTMGDARDILRAMGTREVRDGVEGAPSVITDAAADKVRRYTRQLSERYLEMVLQETTYAVPEATLRARSFAGEIRPGTGVGELMRSIAQFKGFGMAVALLHGGRVYNELAAGRVGVNAVPYAAGALAVLATYGMISMQSKQLAKGEDPRDMTDWRTWAGALAQSGGAGIYGDFFLADHSRFGGSLTGTVAGPVVGRIEKLAQASLGNVQQAAADKRTNAGREAVNLMQSLDPTSSLWWTKAAMDRMVYSQLRRLADPEAPAEERRRIDTARRDRGTGFWWRPGEPFPGGAPDFGNAVGGR